MQDMANKGFRYLGNALKITLGAGAVLGGSYLFSRISEKQDTESSLSRLEQMLEELSETATKEKAPGGRKK
jgi:hypothetical protein